MTQPLLQFRHVDKSFFAARVLKDVCLSAAAGRVLGLVGENGAGKSTLMNILGGILPADAGEILLDGAPFAPRTPQEAARAGIALVHQELNLFTNLSIAENLFLTDFPQRRLAAMGWIRRRELRRRTDDLLRAVGLSLAAGTDDDGIRQGLRPGPRARRHYPPDVGGCPMDRRRRS